MFVKLLHFLINIEEKGVLSAVVWVRTGTTGESDDGQMFPSPPGCVKGQHTKHLFTQPVTDIHPGAESCSLLITSDKWDLKASHRCSCFQEKRKLRRLGKRKLDYFVSVGFCVDEKCLCATFQVFFKNPPYSNLQKSKCLEQKLQFSRGRWN